MLLMALTVKYRLSPLGVEDIIEQGEAEAQKRQWARPNGGRTGSVGPNVEAENVQCTCGMRWEVFELQDEMLVERVFLSEKFDGCQYTIETPNSMTAAVFFPSPLTELRLGDLMCRPSRLPGPTKVDQHGVNIFITLDSLAKRMGGGAVVGRTRRDGGSWDVFWEEIA